MFKLVKKDKKRKVLKSTLSINVIEKTFLKKKLIICNQDIIDQIYLNEIFLLMRDLSKKILIHLEEDDDPEETALLYDELARLRSIILKQYEGVLSKRAIAEYMKNIRFLALNLQKKLRNLSLEKSPIRSR
ncbi:MAG TPA: hypothetical protein GX713_04130 [Mollicutes bacterium]|nr:hypothetical protein [Mollicutes bacterium]